MNRAESRAQYSTSKGHLDSPRSLPGKHLCRNGSRWLDWLHRLEIRMTPSMMRSAWWLSHSGSRTSLSARTCRTGSLDEDHRLILIRRPGGWCRASPTEHRRLSCSHLTWFRDRISQIDRLRAPPHPSDAQVTRPKPEDRPGRACRIPKSGGWIPWRYRSVSAPQRLERRPEGRGGMGWDVSRNK